MRRRLDFFSIALSLVLIAEAVSGQARLDGEAVLGERVDVLVVNVEATVRDRQGRPVDGLTRDDFRVRVDGEEVEVSHFVALAEDASGVVPPVASPVEPAAADASPDVERSPLQLVVYVDNSSVDPVRRNAVLGQIREFLRPRLSAGDRILLALASASGLEPLHAYTDRWDVLEPGFERLVETAAHDRRATEFRDILRGIERFVVAGSGFQKISIESQIRTLQSRIRAYSAESHRDAERTATHLYRLVMSQAGWPGRKAVLYLGGSLSLRPGSALHAALSQALGRFPTSTGEEPDTATPTGSPDDAGGIFRRLAEAASARDVVLHAISAGDPTEISSHSLTRGAVAVGAGLAPGREEAFAPGVSFTRRIELQSSLELLADTTGGVARFDGQDLALLFDELAGASRGKYSLGIQPPTAMAAGEHHIEIEVRGRGRSVRHHSVRHRRVARVATGDEAAARRAQAALMTGVGEQPFEVRLTTGTPRAADDGLFAVPLSVQVPVAALALTAEAHAHTGQVSIFIATGDGVLATGAVRKAVFPVTLPNDRLLEAMGQHAEYRIELRLPAGSAEIACTVRDDLDHRLASAATLLTVGEPAAQGPAR